MLVGDYPGVEEALVGEPFVSRKGVWLRKTLGTAGIDVDRCFLTLVLRSPPASCGRPSKDEILAARRPLWDELRAVRPKVVVTLGPLPTRLLLKPKRNFRMADVAGRFVAVPFMAGLVVPWYSPHRLLKRGRDADVETIEFFYTVKEKL